MPLLNPERGFSTATLQVRNGSFRLIFRYHGKQFTFTVGQVSEEEPKDTAARVRNLLRGRGVEEGRIRVPAGLDILRNRNITTHSNGTIEENSLLVPGQPAI